MTASRVETELREQSVSELAATLAATIDAIAYALVAGVLALRGKARVQEATPPVREQAVESANEDVQFATRRLEEARQ
jgi:hypothetical protein